MSTIGENGPLRTTDRAQDARPPLENQPIFGPLGGRAVAQNGGQRSIHDHYAEMMFGNSDNVNNLAKLKYSDLKGSKRLALDAIIRTNRSFEVRLAAKNPTDEVAIDNDIKWFVAVTAPKLAIEIAEEHHLFNNPDLYPVAQVVKLRSERAVENPAPTDNEALAELMAEDSQVDGNPEEVDSIETRYQQLRQGKNVEDPIRKTVDDSEGSADDVLAELWNRL